MWCRRGMEKISWTYHVRNEEVLLRVKEQRNILHEIRKWKANWIGDVLRINCLLQRVIEGKIKEEIEVTGYEEEDVGSYWMTLTKGEDTLIWKRKLWIALCGEHALEEALDLSQNRLLNDEMMYCTDIDKLYIQSHEVNMMNLWNETFMLRYVMLPKYVTFLTET